MGEKSGDYPEFLALMREMHDGRGQCLYVYLSRSVRMEAAWSRSAVGVADTGDRLSIVRGG
jgi:hypothetical protein